MLPLSLKQMEYFVCVVEAGSFSRAAAILRVAQPALSRQIGSLEEALGARLLVRNGRGALPTEEGEIFLNECRGILRQVSRVQEEMARVRTGIGGKVAIGMPSSVCSYLAAPIVKRLRETHPGLALQIIQGRSAALQEALSSGRLDLALLYDVSALTNVEKLTLWQDRLVLVQPAGGSREPIRLEEVSRVPLIMRPQPNMVRNIVEAHLARIGQGRAVVDVEIDSIFTILELVRDGVGSAVVSRSTVKGWHDARNLTVREIVEPRLPVPLHLVVPARPATAVPGMTGRLIDEIRETVGRCLGRTSEELAPDGMTSVQLKEA